MQLYSENVRIGEYRLSDYGLTVGSFDVGGLSDDGLGLAHETVEKFVGNRSVPVYLGANFKEKLQIKLTIIKNPYCQDGGTKYLTKELCQSVLKNLTGRKGYTKLFVYDENYDEPIHYNVRCVNASYNRIGGNVAGITLELECDSPYAWFERKLSLNTTANKTFNVICNSDSLDEYVLPIVEITSVAAQDITITNLSDNRETAITLSANETITIDSSNGTITSSKGDYVYDRFNCIFPKLISGRNEFVLNGEVNIKFIFCEPRKVGVL